MERSEIIAALGPTNTGKTFRALARMREHETGMIGLPLRLLAREVYDSLVRDLGESSVALITGEEKLIPRSPRYWVCTVEAMPVDREVDFLAVDEIQLAGHHERGHVFTNRLLSARGTKETWFIGSDSMIPLVKRLAPTAQLVRYPRLSRLRCEGSYTLSSLPKRSAVVAFSVGRVYELAERLRAKRGGAAIVLGALSPRARNAQVQMYQEGEVDYLVATDAIGLGLNLDITRVAFADTRKFDGRNERALDIGELAQIAGRAGRYQADGAFGTLAPRRPLPLSVSTAIEEHTFSPQGAAYYRNSDLDFSSPGALLDSLVAPPPLAGLHLPPDAGDTAVLAMLLKNKRIEERVTNEAALRLLWDVSQIPDYRKLFIDEHARLTGEIFLELSTAGCLSDDFLRRKILRLREHSGDIDAIVGRIASVRTWAYVSCRPSWGAEGDWQAQTRALDDALSDDLHRALVERFVTKANRVQQRRPSPKKDRSLSSQLESFRAQLDPSIDASPPPLIERVRAAAPADFSLNARGQLSLGSTHLATLVRGKKHQAPQMRFHLEELGGQAPPRELEERLREAGRALVEGLLGPVSFPESELPDADRAILRGLSYRLRAGLGSLRRGAARELLLKLSPRGRRAIDTHPTVLGQRYLYSPQSLGADQLVLRMALVAAHSGALPPADWSPVESFVLGSDNGLSRLAASDYELIGYEVFGRRAVRIDVVERTLADCKSLQRKEQQRRLMTDFCCSQEEAKPVMRQLGLGRSSKRGKARKRTDRPHRH